MKLDKTIQTKLYRHLESVLKFIEDGTLAIKKEIPSLVKELLTFSRFNELCNFIVPLIAALLATVLLGGGIYLGTWIGKTFVWPDAAQIWVQIVVYIISLVIYLIIICNLPYRSWTSLLKCLLAPRLYLIDEVKEYLR